MYGLTINLRFRIAGLKGQSDKGLQLVHMQPVDVGPSA